MTRVEQSQTVQRRLQTDAQRKHPELKFPRNKQNKQRYLHISAYGFSADAYATAFMAMGFENSKGLLSILDDVEAYLTYTDSGNIQQVFMTEGMEKLVKSN